MLTVTDSGKNLLFELTGLFKSLAKIVFFCFSLEIPMSLKKKSN